MFEFECDQAKSFRKARSQKTKTNASHKPINYGRYKTEMCRQYSENGECKYGDKCQFAHGINELKDVNRHPKYKTDFCKTFHSKGFCPYGPRCHFIHDINDKLECKANADESGLLASLPLFELTPPLPHHQNIVFNNLANSASSCSSSSSQSSQSPSPNCHLVSSSRSSLFENEFHQFGSINSQAIDQLNQLINSLLSINMGQSVAPSTPLTSCKNR